jgi:hypothetical protein
MNSTRDGSKLLHAELHHPESEKNFIEAGRGIRFVRTLAEEIFIFAGSVKIKTLSMVII